MGEPKKRKSKKSRRTRTGNREGRVSTEDIFAEKQQKRRKKGKKKT